MNARPDYGWLSEETIDSKSRLSKERVWIVDPLDGTKEFIEGVPQFVVSVALVENGVPIIGVLHNPVTKETFHASKDNGTYFENAVHNCSVKELTTDMVMLNSRSETRKGLWEPHKRHFKKLKPIGSVAYKLALVSAGKYDIFATIAPKNEWDICAGDCLISESNGTFKTINDKKIIYNQKKTLVTDTIIATNSILFEGVSDLLF